MTATLQVVYEDGVLRPLTQVPYINGTRLTAALTDQSTVGKLDVAYLLTLTRPERNRILAEAAESAVALYEDDLTLPVAERELTAFTALDGEPFRE